MARGRRVGTDTLTSAEFRRLNGLPPPGADRAPKNLRVAVQTETQLQVAVADWLRNLEWPAPAPVWTHPAGERKSKAESIRCWRMGQLSGVPDLLFWLPDGWTLAIELKTPKGTLQASQRAVHAQLRELQHPVEVCRSIDEVHAALLAAGALFEETPAAKAIRESAR